MIKMNTDMLEVFTMTGTIIDLQAPPPGYCGLLALGNDWLALSVLIPGLD